MVSKSGAALKVITPADEIANSVPLIEYVRVSPSASLAETEPIANWFSAAL